MMHRAKQSVHFMHFLPLWLPPLAWAMLLGPSVAIFTGGPGALFWLLVYIFFGSVTKFVEVIFAIRTRERLPDGYIVGGPMNYLKKISPALAYWYALVIIFLFVSWSALQANTLAAIYAQESIPEWVVGLGLAALVFFTLTGGAQRIGAVASKLVPLMFVLYVTFAGLILLQNPLALYGAFRLIAHSVFNPMAFCGGALGFGVLHAMRAGIYRAIFITEAGLGTSSIAHAITDAKNPVDQGLLALFSMAADGFLALLSGLIVLVTGVCMQGTFRSTLIYEAFKLHSPAFGSYVLLISVTLFVLTTVMGNSFNGVQSFAALTRHRWTSWYIAFTTVLIFAGALLPVQFMWNVADMLLTLVAVPNLIGVLILAFRNPDALELKK